MPVAGLDHVQLAAPAGCEQQARDFFGRLLELPEIEKPAALRARGGVWFACGEQQLHIGIEAVHRPSRKAHPALRVEPGRLGELAERLRQAGTEVDWDASLPDQRRFYASDPWGNRIEFIEAPPACGAAV